MAGVDKKKLQQSIAKALENSNFNLYSFLELYS
jgi:hypothetical protein